MTKRGAGIGLIAVAAFLFAMKYVSAAIFGSGVLSWDASLFNAMLQYVGPGLSNWARIALVAGVGYVVWGEISERKEH